VAESKRLELAFRGEAPPDGGAELYLSFDDEGGHVDGYRVEGAFAQPALPALEAVGWTVPL
jgi:hypothetical protein